MQRLQEIDSLTAAHEEAWHAYAECAAEPGLWEAVVERWDFTEVNDLIDRHNRWYPAEARLPMDPRTSDYALVNGERY